MGGTDLIGFNGAGPVVREGRERLWSVWGIWTHDGAVRTLTLSLG
jgi:hypothetical protein